MLLTDPALRPALRASLPVLFGYVPLGMAFGVLFVDLGHPWIFATLMSVLVYAGAAQFLAIGLLGAGAGLLEIGVATLVLNARHAFFGLSLAARFPRRGLARLYMIFALTDETYSLLSSVEPPAGVDATRLRAWIAACNQFWWVLGSTLGALLGTGLALDTAGLDFALTALFVVLAIEQYRAIRDLRPFGVAVIAAALAIGVVGTDHLLIAGLAIATALILLDPRRKAWPGSAT